MRRHLTYSNIVATLDGIEDGTLSAVPQPTVGVSHAPKVTVGDARVDWTAPAVHIDRVARACTPAPGAWTTWRGVRVKLGPVLPDDRHRPARHGELVVQKDAVFVGTATEPVRLGDVQEQGKRRMAATEWARGARIASGEQFE